MKNLHSRTLARSVEDPAILAATFLIARQGIMLPRELVRPMTTQVFTLPCPQRTTRVHEYVPRTQIGKKVCVGWWVYLHPIAVDVIKPCTKSWALLAIRRPYGLLLILDDKGSWVALSSDSNITFCLGEANSPMPSTGDNGSSSYSTSCVVASWLDTTGCDISHCPTSCCPSS